MPKGRKIQRGGGRHFTNPEELAAQQSEVDKERGWRKEKEGSDASSGEESEEEDAGKGKAKGGAQALIEVENPNLVQLKSKKMSELTLEEMDSTKPILSRKEREEVEKQEAKARYQKLHAEGKTEEAQSDLARLAIIRKEREAAAKKREMEKLAKEKSKQEAKLSVAAKLDGGAKAGPGGRGKKKKKAKADGAGES